MSAQTLPSARDKSATATFRSTAGSTQSGRSSSNTAVSPSHASWGRNSDDGGSSRKDDGNHLTVFRRRGRKSGGFLMGNIFEPNNKNVSDDTTGRDKSAEPGPSSSPARPSPGRSSPARSSPRRRSLLGKKPATPSNMDGANSSHVSSVPPASLDPSQLVQMALTLSEGRRRHASATLSAPNTTADDRRIRSTGNPTISVVPGSPMGNDAMRADHRPSVDANHAFIADDQVDFDFSQATLHRAERARKFFELSSEYRRLLGQLPPLKPNPSAGDCTFVAHGSPREGDTQKEMGRDYNPLQLLRNRKARHREQRPLDPPVDAFDDVAKVKSYIDETESEASDAAYRATLDTSLLPSFQRLSRTQDSPTQVTRGHKRSDTAVSKITRPENDWSFTPSELLADAVWLLQPEHRNCIENRHGHKIFPPPPRSSFESARSGRRSGDSRPSITISRTDTWGSTAVKSDEEHTDRGRKRGTFLSLRHAENTGRKHLFRNRSRSSSRSSISSSHPSDRKKRFLGPGNDPDFDNTAPLERQMKKLIENEDSLGDEQKSPELISPGQWNRPSEHSASPKSQLDSPSINTHVRTDSDKSDDHAQAHHDYDRGRFSFDDSTAPNSPAHLNHIPSFGMSLSPPPSRQSSPERKKFGFFRPGHKNPSEDMINRTDFAAQSQASLINSRHVSDNTDPPRSSIESFRPTEIRRHKTTNSITNNLFSTGARDSKEGGVGRFFKSGRIGDLVRSESSRQNASSRKKDYNSDTSDADTISEAEEEYDDVPKLPPNIRSNTLMVGASSKEKTKQKYHMPNLPSFKSKNQTTKGDLEPLTGDPIGRQNKLHRDQGRSSRFERLAPPRINLPNDDGLDNPPVGRTISRMPSTDSIQSETGFLSPLPKTRSSERSPGAFKSNLSTVQTSSPQRRPSPGNRQWSISDRFAKDKQAELVTIRDIARVRALYLCSGIKAHEICNRAESMADPPSDFFCAAAKASGDGQHAVRFKEEYTVAARMLSRAVNTGTSKLQKDLSAFRSDTIPDLHNRLDELRHKVDEKFTPLVHSTADDADAFTVALTTQHTLAIKQVNDAIDRVLRRRRRNLIFLQRACFTMLEWVLLGVMWCVWFIVVVIQLFKGVIMGFGKGVKWMLWL